MPVLCEAYIGLSYRPDDIQQDRHSQKHQAHSYVVLIKIVQKEYPNDCKVCHAIYEVMPKEHAHKFKDKAHACDY